MTQPAPSLRLRCPLAFAILLLTALSYFVFPGHTWLQADTQIYLPILERLYDPSVLPGDLVAQRPHVAFTIYDEVTIALRRLSGLDFFTLLTIQQWIFRAAGILGAFLIAAALGLSPRAALLVAAVFSLGATVVGPSVLTIEYEPVPRGFAAPLILLALGLAGHGRDLAAGCAATLAFLYHPPTAAAFWGLYFLLALWPAPPSVMLRRIAGLAPLALGVLVLLVASRLQPGISEPQMLFSRLDPELEQLQRWRAPYNWISTWDPAWFRLYLLLSLAAFLAFRQLQRAGAFLAASALNRSPRPWPAFDLEIFLLGLPLFGLAGVPASYLLLDRLKLAVASQLQPARHLLYLVALTSILTVSAAVKAAERRRWWESLLWLFLAYAVPAHLRLLQFAGPDLLAPPSRRRILLVLLLAALATAALAARRARPLLALPLWGLAMLAPFFAIPGYGKVQNYPNLHNPELLQLSAWARGHTPPDAVFLFADAPRDLFPGIFRAQALRTVYVDWKSGGQANFLRGFALEWARRWRLALQGGFRPDKLPALAAEGIDYIVLRKPRTLRGRSPAFENSRFVVYRLAAP